jgi:cadherin-like protein/VCBS repeat protein
MADFTVTTLIDENDGGAGGTGLSLREALALANGNGSATSDTITFATGPGTLFLTSGQQLSITTDGITIDGDIDGNGTADITIDADSGALANDAQARVFSISDAAASTISATLNGLVIRDGNNTEAGNITGGGVFVGQGDVLTLTNATVTGNFSGNGGGIGGGVNSAITVIDSTVSDNVGLGGGGGIYGGEGSNITVVESTISGNTSLLVFLGTARGGGILVGRQGSLSLTSSTVSDNQSSGPGGGIGSLFGGVDISLTNSTVAGNQSTTSGGGGIDVTGANASSTVTLTNSTVSGNLAATVGGGLSVTASILSVTQVHVTLANSIIAGNDTGTDTLRDVDFLVANAPRVYSGGNIIGGTLFAGMAVQQTGIALTDIFDAIDPATGGGLLADNGGPVQTIALDSDAGNPAINTGTAALPADTHDLDSDNDTTEPLPVDARGLPRVALGTADLGAFEVEPEAASLVVTTAADVVDPLDNETSLREALAFANSTAGTDTITFVADLDGETLFLSGGQLTITDTVTIDGDRDNDGVADITISARPDANTLATSRVLAVDGGATAIAATLDGLVIRDGRTTANGGGISVGNGDALTLIHSTVTANAATGLNGQGGGIYGSNNSTVTLIGATVSDNTTGDGSSVGSADGGGIAVRSGSTLTLLDSTVSGNRATGIGADGGGIYAGSSVPVTLTNTTVVGNSASDSGGGIYGAGGNPITLVNSTVTGNRAVNLTGGIYNFGTATTTLVNSIVAGNTVGTTADDLFGTSGTTLRFVGGNVVGSDPATSGAGTRTGTTPVQINGTDQAALETVFADVAVNATTGILAGVLADNGGLVQTVALNRDAANPAIDSGDATQLSEAAVGKDLNHDGDTDDTITTDARGLARVSGGLDLGAFEAEQEAASLVVTTAADVVDPFDNQTSLREALAFANATAGADTITFDPGLTTGGNDGHITLSLGELVISSDVTIDGDVNDGADITIDAGGASRVFSVTDGTSTLEALVITGGEAGTGFGGGVNILALAELTIVNTTVADNDADRGGGIHNAGTLTLVNATLSGNSSIPGNGGGLYNAGTAVLTNVTLAGNSAELGGGMFNASAGIATLTNTTVSGNTASDGAGIRNAAAAGQFTLANSIVLGHVVPGNFPEIYGTVTYAGVNIVGLGGDFDPDGGVMNAPSGDAVFAQTTPGGAGILADNGGTLQTIALNTDPANLARNSGVAARLDETAVGIDLNGDGDELDKIATDARGTGFARTGGAGPDLGAFEIQNSDPTQAVNLGANVDEGDTVVISQAALDFDDAEQADGDITYTITTAPANGTLVLGTTDLNVGDSFTQADIANGELSYEHDGGETTADSVAFDVSDGVGGTASGTFALTINPLNDTAGGTAGGTIVYNEDQGPTALDPSLTVTDPDDTHLEGAQVAITANFAAGQDVLAFTPQAGINGSYDPATGVLTFTGHATLADYEALLRSVSYFNTSQNPSNLQRTVSFQVDDGGGFAPMGNVGVDVIPVLDPPGDLNGDHTSDVVWRSDDGIVALWEMAGVSVLANNGIATIPDYWHIVDADSDFDGDGRADILWQDDAGVVVLWTMDGPNILSNTAVAGPLPDYWHIEDTGDFTGDGRADILWRDDAGRVVLWEMDGADIVSNTLVADVATTSQIQDTADFTGDGRNDILWRDPDGTLRIWEMDGATVLSEAVAGSVLDTRHFIGSGDFNGDERFDLLWRDDDGTVTLWEMGGAMTFITVLGTLPDYWHVADIGDYTGDRNSDILWRDTTGTIVLWEMNGPTIVDNTAVNTIPTSWHIEA